MIESVRIVNFKSLAAVTIPLGHFTCLVGMNGAGKSTVLQALDFVSQLMRGDVQGWLDRRGWTASDLRCKLRTEFNSTFTVTFKTSAGASLVWIGAFNRADLRCTKEAVVLIQPEKTDLKVLRSNGQIYSLGVRESQSIAFEYQGSILSALKDSELQPELLEFRDALRNVRSLELLSPDKLRKSARASEHDIGSGGEKLSAYLDTIKGERKTKLVMLLQKFYPALVDYKITSQRSGWKKLSVFEQFGNQKLETDALHLNDGLLRILAVLTQADADRSLLLLDELENGINQEIVETLVDTLLESPQQLLVTTHSPLLLNYLPDAVARTAVQFLYKTPQGETRIKPFFDIPRMSAKLEAMGPGDAFVDTDLRLLAQECMELDAQIEAVERAEAEAESKAVDAGEA
ncbi:chromosome segregation protein SMC [Limnohabitans sp. TS-CS-82]|uniref:AAA family ATPase n=1 Tax=Limnohabitans sp. TS-CS-82 TaxID=2094193 RepID=UPI000CF2D755|nr:AAA family ATPase [Limnohabitans sp. TS-CS-82]PQA81931.1 chromosome segregation protein SMC [Limnohabitans sp. TS-CS-82]